METFCDADWGGNPLRSKSTIEQLSDTRYSEFQEGKSGEAGEPILAGFVVDWIVGD